MIKKSELIKERDYWKKEAKYWKADRMSLYDYGAIEHCQRIEHYEMISRLEIAGIISSEQKAIIFEKLKESDERMERILKQGFEMMKASKEES